LHGHELMALTVGAGVIPGRAGPDPLLLAAPTGGVVEGLDGWEELGVVLLLPGPALAPCCCCCWGAPKQGEVKGQ
jgi:hypothetical protein